MANQNYTYSNPVGDEYSQSSTPPPAYNSLYDSQYKTNYGYTQSSVNTVHPGGGYDNYNNYADQAQPPKSEGDPESQFTTSSFSEKSIRLAFIKKVFAILALQLILTGGIMCVFMFSDTVKEYSQTHPWLYIGSLIVYLVMVFTIICVESLRRKVPTNLIMLFIVTAAMGVMLGSIVTYYETDEVLMAVGIVFAIVLVMSALGLQTKYDFTWMVGFLLILTVSLMMFGIFCAIFRSGYLQLFYAWGGAVLFSLWLLVDIQLMMGGSHKYSISPEEYIMAALNLYLDIVNILLYVLLIIGGKKN